MFHPPAAVPKYYQGTSLCSPFFFLLVDSVLGFAAHGWLESLLVPSLLVVLQSAVVAARVPLAVAVGVLVPLAPGVEAAAPVVGAADDPLTAAPGAPAGASTVAVVGGWFDCVCGGSAEGAPPTISPEVPVTDDGIPSGATPPSEAGGPASGTSSEGALAPVGTA